MLKTKLMIVLSLFVMASCGTPPKMRNPVKVWNGSPERGSICRINSDKVSQETGIPKNIVKQVVANVSTQIDCIDAYDDQFKKYACMTFDDLGSLYEYSERLINSCQRWKRPKGAF